MAEEKNTNCLHSDIIDENGLTICMDCGEEINRNISNDKEWRYYGRYDTKHNSDPTRVHQRKTEERTIFKDVENMGFSDKIVSHANNIYTQVTKGKIVRGYSRKSIVFSCIYYAYKLSDKPQTHDYLINIFQIDKKNALHGLNTYL